MKPLFNVLIILGIVLGSCSSKKNVADSAEPIPSSNLPLPEIVLSFEQTACFGSCPVHKMVIQGDGSATYFAERNTSLEGNFRGSFSRTEIDAIFSTLDSLSFFSADAEYTAPVTDMPTTIMYVNTGQQKHQVIAYYGYPENVQKAIQYLYQITQNKKWAEEEK